MSRGTLSAINIQFPISQLILSGEKIVETRTYPLPKNYEGKELFIIETPGKSGNFEARIVGKIVFSGCFPYANSKTFYADYERHKVDRSSPWKWKDSSPKWGWLIAHVEPFKAPKRAPKKKGIVFTRNVGA